MRGPLLALLLIAATVGGVAAAQSSPAPLDQRCDRLLYTVHATDEDPYTVETPFAGWYENQSGPSRAVFDRARANEGSPIRVPAANWSAVEALPSVVLVRATNTTYRTTREGRDCDGGRGPLGPVPLLAAIVALAVLAACLTALLVYGTVIRDG